MGFSELDFKTVVSEMAQLGIDLIEIAGDDYANSSIGFPGLAHLVNQLVDVPIALSGGFRQISTMEEALGKGDAAMIGICTPMVVMPDLPNRILAATYQPFAMPLTTGNRWVDNRLQSVMENGYCEAQMKRLGAGKAPEIYANGWRAVWDSVRLHGRDGLRTRRPVREEK